MMTDAEHREWIERAEARRKAAYEGCTAPVWQGYELRWSPCANGGAQYWETVEKILPDEPEMYVLFPWKLCATHARSMLHEPKPARLGKRFLEDKPGHWGQTVSSRP